MAVIGFTTLDEAEIYASSILTTTWDSADTTQKEKALGTAYNLMLSYANTYDYSIVTTLLKNIQAELAIYLYQIKDSVAVQNIQMGITQKSIGNTSESYDTANSNRYQRIPDYIFQMMIPFYKAGFTVDIEKDNKTL